MPTDAVRSELPDMLEAAAKSETYTESVNLTIFGNTYTVVVSQADEGSLESLLASIFAPLAGGRSRPVRVEVMAGDEVLDEEVYRGIRLDMDEAEKDEHANRIRSKLLNTHLLYINDSGTVV